MRAASLLTALGLLSSSRSVDPGALRKVSKVTRFDRRRVYAKLECGHEVLVDWGRHQQGELTHAPCDRC